MQIAFSLYVIIINAGKVTQKSDMNDRKRERKIGSPVCTYGVSSGSDSIRHSFNTVSQSLNLSLNSESNRRYMIIMIFAL